MSQAALSLQPEFGLTVLNGADKGATYKLMAGRITLGRGIEADIIIKDDPKISRVHAEINIDNGKIEITDVSDKNKLFVNGKEVKVAHLNSGTVIQLGNTKFVFKSLSKDAYLDQVVGGQDKSRNELGQPARKKRRSSSGRPAPNKNFYIILVIIGLLCFWLFTSKSKNATDGLIRTDEQQLADIQNETALADAKTQEQEKLGKNTAVYKDAKTNFIKGFRDYRNGQYERAMESFDTCARILPQCQTYYSLSLKKFDDLLQTKMNYGRKFKDQGQYGACMSEFKNIMVMVKDKSKQIYKEAEANWSRCKAEMSEGAGI